MLPASINGALLQGLLMVASRLAAFGSANPEADVRLCEPGIE
jgi:hypothetical protein